MHWNATEWSALDCNLSALEWKGVECTGSAATTREERSAASLHSFSILVWALCLGCCSPSFASTRALWMGPCFFASREGRREKGEGRVGSVSEPKRHGEKRGAESGACDPDLARHITPEIQEVGARKMWKQGVLLEFPLMEPHSN